MTEGLKVTVSKDKMEAYLELDLQRAPLSCRYDEIIQLIKNTGIVYGIIGENIEKFVNDSANNRNILIAAGKKPEIGQNGFVEYHFDIDFKYQPTVLENGNIDYKQLNLVQSALEGQKLATVRSPVQGREGCTVTGKSVMAPPVKFAVLPKMKNAALNEEGNAIVAKLAGQIIFNYGLLMVNPVYEVQTDVGTATGNINFLGNVRIKGGVLSGMVVEAAGYIEVGGFVENAVLKAGGDIILKSGMHGSLDVTGLSSEANIYAKYIENSNIEAKRDIYADVIRHTKVKCGGSLMLNGNKGVLAGGTVKSGKDVSAKVIGSNLNTVTEIYAGSNPQLRDEEKKCAEELKSVEKELNEIIRGVSYLGKQMQTGEITSEHRELLVKMLGRQKTLQTRTEELQLELLEIKESLEQGANAKISAADIIYKGVILNIGPHKRHLGEDCKYCTFLVKDNDIMLVSYQGKV